MNEAEAIRDALCAVVEACKEPGIRSAAVYMSKKMVVRATNRFRPKKGGKTEMIVVMGKPNYAQRQHIAMCKRKGFNLTFASPVKKAYPVKKK